MGIPSLICAVFIAFAYTPRVSENDGDPWNTACMTRPRDGTAAVSQDVFRSPGFRCGDVIHVDGTPYIVNDTMHRSHRRTVDIWMRSLKDATQFGRREVIVCSRR